MWQQVDFPCSTEWLHNHEQITLPLSKDCEKEKKKHGFGMTGMYPWKGE